MTRMPWLRDVALWIVTALIPALEQEAAKRARQAQ
jgi:hypothetical protein